MEETACPVESCNQRIGGSRLELHDSNRFIKCDQLVTMSFGYLYISENISKFLKRTSDLK